MKDKKKPLTAVQAVGGSLAALRSSRTRLYRALGHKALGAAGDDARIEAYEIWKRLDADMKRLARLHWKLKVRENAAAIAKHVEEHRKTGTAVDAHAAHLKAHAKAVV